MDTTGITTAGGTTTATTGAPPAPASVHSRLGSAAPLDYLHLGRAATRQLAAMGLRTVDALVGAVRAGELAGKRTGADAVNGVVRTRVLEALATLDQARTADGAIDWFAYWSACGVQVVPSSYVSTPVLADRVRYLPALLRAILETDTGSHLWVIVRHRYGLEGAQIYTLDQLGRTLKPHPSSARAAAAAGASDKAPQTAAEAASETTAADGTGSGTGVGLTRERVRQKEMQALQMLRDVLLQERCGHLAIQVHPELHELTTAFCDLLTPLKPAVREDHLIACVTAAFGAALGTARGERASRPGVRSAPTGLLEILLTLLDFQCLDGRDATLSPLWVTIRAPREKQTLLARLQTVHHCLTAELPTAQAWSDFQIHVNTHLPPDQRMSVDELRHVVDLCSTLERQDSAGGEVVQARFEHLQGRANQVERLLTEHGTPLTVRALARELNHRLVPCGHRPVDLRTLGNMLVDCDRVEAIGRSGQWKLRAWSQFATDSIRDHMERYLMARNTPATVDEIYAAVSAQRPAQRTAIGMYLTMAERRGQPVFKPMGVDTWGLADWDGSPGTVWDAEEVRTLLTALLKQERRREIAYTAAKAALMEAAGLSAPQAQGRLNHNPYVVVRKDPATGARFLSLAPVSPGAGEDGIPSGRRRGRRTRSAPLQSEQIAALARQILETAPRHELQLAHLVRQIQERLGYPKPTVYGGVRQLDFIERTRAPGSATILCRLAGQPPTLTFPEVNGITTEALRDEVKRALPLLTEEQVDMGLFALGRAFEHTLKRCLIAGIRCGACGAVTDPALRGTPTRWKLAQMVEWAKSLGIVTDAAAGHYLRYERNERAHGVPPSLQERRALMASLGSLARMYIHYISLLDDQANAWEQHDVTP